ncbi:STAS domain-containing protein [Paenibacillus hexagrammi]|uniref:STAS domain-containing protein n=1 Tax=Paenibacillus hexagrammi TaxID=2908839 RepID=A0ABY3SGC0_9BACL|nr:STAS domain-containing protein [Paenibacillus sp. YPD9-1]UJF32882.1 STAS domain-containing protein [Paenibacillus sp. YPD9-1]
MIADAALQAGRSGRQLVISGARAAVAEILAIVRFDTFMHIFTSVEEAYEFYQLSEG